METDIGRLMESAREVFISVCFLTALWLIPEGFRN